MVELTTAECIGIFIGAILTLMMYSFLYKDNVFYKFGEHLYVGISVGYLVCITWHNVLLPIFIIPAFYKQELILVIPAVLGLMMLARFIRQVSWLSRTPMAMIMGYGAGLSIPAMLGAFIMRQVDATIMQLWQGPDVAMGGLWLWNTFSLWVIFIGVLSTLFYFYFSIEHKGMVGKLGTVGIWFIMISFGASFGYTVMARVSLLIGRVQFLIDKVPEAFTTLIGAGP